MGYTRETAHATFNGGHCDEPAHSAFHHGMDTVFNLIDAGEVVALSEVCDLREVVRGLHEFQLRYETATWEPGRMPGNELYSKQLMMIVGAARRALDKHGHSLTDGNQGAMGPAATPAASEAK